MHFGCCKYKPFVFFNLHVAKHYTLEKNIVLSFYIPENMVLREFVAACLVSRPF